jgi:hypothetical protein
MLAGSTYTGCLTRSSASNNGSHRSVTAVSTGSAENVGVAAAVRANTRPMRPLPSPIRYRLGVIEVKWMGVKTARRGAILVTDRRVILYTKKLGGYEMNDHVYGLLTRIRE